jgi:hypothetical protein
MSRWWILVSVLNVGCVAQRYLVMPESLAPEATPTGFPANQTWRLGEVTTTRVELSAQGMQGGGLAPPNIDTEPLKRQLTERVRSSLVSQKNLGAVDEPSATYSLEVELAARESYGIGKGLALGLLLETGILLGGLGAGIGVGTLIDNNAPNQPRLGGILGSSIGILVAAPVALLAAFLPDIAAVKGEYLASLTLRRRSDRVPVATRRLTSNWRTDYNMFGIEEKLAKASGAAVPEFERLLIEAVKSMLVELNEPLARAD